MHLDYRASEDVRAAIVAIGRTEDIHFSPANDRLALAGMHENAVLVLDVAIDAGETVTVELRDHLTLRCGDFKHPHGLFWLDDEHLAVGSRKGEVVIVAVPRERPASRKLDVTPLLRLRADDRDLVRSPGSLTAVELQPGLTELLVCNNTAHYVTRHLLDRRDRLAAAPAELLFREGLDLPDGVAVSGDRRWTAVSNHNGHCVHLHAREQAPPLGRPQGILRGLTHPHGLRFAPDGRFLFVADADSPFVHVFADEAADWSGERLPVLSIPMIDDDSYWRGHTRPGEGGPKGISVDRLGTVLVSTCKEQPLLFRDIRADLRRAGAAFASSGGVERAAAEQLRSVRDELARVRDDAQRTRMELEAARLRAAARERELEAMRQSSSWQLTGPMRALSQVLHHVRREGLRRLKKLGRAAGLTGRNGSRFRTP